MRDAARNDPEPYHEQCRRCSSCYQVVSKEEVVKLCGQVFCKTCEHLFGKFFVPTRRAEGDRLKEAFQAWDNDGSGVIETEELRRVLKALDPDFADRDLGKFMDLIDTNRNGVIEYDEFCDWVMKGSPLKVTEEDTFENEVTHLMREAGVAAQQAQQNIAEVHAREDGIFFVGRNGKEIQQTDALVSKEVELTILDPEEFICKLEAVAAGLTLTMNTGRVSVIKCQGDPFGPWHVAEGFEIIGLRTKPTDRSSFGRVVGIEISPLPAARSYDAPTSLRFAAEHEFLTTLRRLLSKAAVDVNGFGPGGLTALMLASARGNIGSMRLLLSSKANPNITDADGWTALTFASRCGQTSAVDVLLERGAKEDGDSGAALQVALQHQHNSAARALLRAGLGPAKPGTFACEEPVKLRKGGVGVPRVWPAGSAFSSPVSVHMSFGKPDAFAGAEEAPDDEVHEPGELSPITPTGSAKILYSLDGRNPLISGSRYRHPIQLSAPRTHLKAVAIQGRSCSPMVEEVFVVSHYAVPDEVVTGSFSCRGFPEAQELISSCFADVLGEPEQRFKVHVGEASSTSRSRWIRVPVTDPAPRHLMKIDRSFASIRGAKLAKWSERMTADIQRAVGEGPTSLEVRARTGGGVTHKAGAIDVEFTLPHRLAMEVSRHLQDPQSYLLTAASCRTFFQEATLDVIASLGSRMMEPQLKNGLHEALSKKAAVDEVLSIGNGDEGVIAVAVPDTEVKKLKDRSFLKKSIQARLPDAVLGELRECPDNLEVSFVVDIVSGRRFGEERFDGGVLVRDFNKGTFGHKLEARLSSNELPTRISTITKAASRELARLEFRASWGAGGGNEYLDLMCLVYQANSLKQVVDRSSQDDQRFTYDGAQSAEADTLCRSIGRCVIHDGDRVSEDSERREHRILVDLYGLPPDVTDLFFVLLAPKGEDIRDFHNPTLGIYDHAQDRALVEYTVDPERRTSAKVMCSLTRDPDHAKWVLHWLHLPSPGTVEDIQPIRRVIGERQGAYSRWERRKELVKLRTLHKLSRLTDSSVSDFASLLKSVLQLPTTAFQTVVVWL